MRSNKQHAKTLRMVQLAILVAIMIIFAFTPLGYLKIGLIEITFMVFPVAMGAILLGPAAGAFLGGVFGVTSFVQCFGMSVFGTFLMSLNPILTFVTCIVPRILCGWLTGLVYRCLKNKAGIVGYYIASLSTALLNTLFFMGCIIAFYWRTPEFLSTMGAWGMTTDSVWIFLVGFVGLNGAVEALVNTLIGGTAAKIVDVTVNKHR